MSFADLEERANAAVMRRLWNATASKVGEALPDFNVIFDRAHIEMQGISTAVPVATVLDTDVTAQAIESNTSRLSIRGATYVVRDIQPDGTGLSLLILEAA